MSEENNGGSQVGFFLAGLGIGAVVALLFAPRSGKETRDMILQKAEDGADFVKTKGEEIRKQAEDAVEKGKDLVNKQKDLSRPRWKLGSKRTRMKSPKRSKAPEAAEPYVSEPWSKILA